MFNDELERMYNNNTFPQHSIEIIMEEKNTKTGRENIYRPTIDKESLDSEFNDNEARLIHFAMCNVSLTQHIFPEKEYLQAEKDITRLDKKIKSIT